MKGILKRGLECMPAPLPELTLDALRFLRYPSVRGDRARQRAILKKLDWDGTIAQGPFAGMGYAPRAYGSMILPKLLGTYECELLPAVEALCEWRPDRIVDVGAAEGYYAVGLALRCPDAPLVCFELNPSARFYLRRQARLNGVLDRLAIRGACTPEALAESLDGAARPAVVCDCEGAEDLLLDPTAVPALRRALVLVETHEGMVEGVNDRLRDRFADTHDLELIASRPRRPADLPPAPRDRLTPDEASLAMDEWRRVAEWMFMRPRVD